MDKEMTLRIPADEARALEVIARAEDMTTDEVIRAAIEREIDAKRSDPEFQSRLRLIAERDAAILDRLAR